MAAQDQTNFQTPEQKLESFGENTNNQAVTLLSVENAIKTRLAQIGKQKEETKALKEMVDSYFLNDPLFQEHEEMAKNAAKQRNATKKALLAKSDAKQIVEKLRIARDEAKELKDGLSYYLTQYQQMTGQNHFEDENGEVRDIVYVARLVRRSAFDK
ncbi:MAG: hypothetical protein A2782_01890 [Candidatus Blackburnbacteria bacterium RIFCSPHIGHO2_01_FULL_43_15b]|uniref:Uncharacterized protein n=1 Tax=Candidatus Blackburnbacteria bacterium RIFCSPHIGHO2_01_FULL_43_15b TaxID=1797513 RepID=A0A1G1V1J2_9BACT|nr:MAG: hypothetical protein A2782_01890 [Candidatus Blackburnbacteria bacterium RIFCSPHIGHO2_01_FULL_43_15b]